MSLPVEEISPTSVAFVSAAKWKLVDCISRSRWARVASTQISMCSRGLASRHQWLAYSKYLPTSVAFDIKEQMEICLLCLTEYLPQVLLIQQQYNHVLLKIGQLLIVLLVSNFQHLIALVSELKMETCQLQY
jgi:hypothetical protein